MVIQNFSLTPWLSRALLLGEMMDLASFLLGLLVGAANALVWVWYAYGGDGAGWIAVHVSGYTLVGVVCWFVSRYRIERR